LKDDDSEKTGDTVFCMALRYNRTRTDEHRLLKYEWRYSTSKEVRDIQ
jgi:hypothetical protein